MIIKILSMCYFVFWAQLVKDTAATAMRVGGDGPTSV